MATFRIKPEENIHQSLIDKFFYRTGWLFFRIVYTLFWRLKVDGLENIPKRGGAIIAANHISLADPQLIGCTLSRQVFYMAKKELFDIPIFGWILRRVNAFPVNRNKSDLTAIRIAKKILSRGELLLMFPQGGRRKNYESEVKEGVGLLSYMAQVPIIPCCIINSDKMKKFLPLSVIFSKPIPPSDKNRRSVYTESANKVVEEIENLKKSSL